MKIFIPGIDFKAGPELEPKGKDSPEPSSLTAPGEMTVWPGVVVKIYRTRSDCLAAGHCRWIANSDCLLAPVVKNDYLSGWCRERAKTKGKSNEKQKTIT